MNPSLIKYLLLFLFLVSSINYSFSQSEADSVRKIINSKTGEERLSNLINIIDSYRLDGQLDKASKYANESLKYSLEIKSLKYQALSLNEFGIIAELKYDFPNSLKYFLRSLQLLEQIKDLRLISIVQNNLGAIYRSLQNYSKAIEFYESSYKIRLKIGDQSTLVETQSGLGAVYYDMNNYDKAIYYFTKCLNQYELMNDSAGLGFMLNNLGSIYLLFSKPNEAIFNYERASKIFLSLEDTLNYAMALANIGNVYNVSGDPKKGIVYVFESMKISGHLASKYVYSSWYIFLEEGFRLSGDYKNALKYQTMLLNLKDTLYNLESNQNIAEMQTKFDTEKKEKANKILRQQNQLQKLNINRQRIITYSIAGGLALVIVLAFFIYRGLRQKKKANLLLERKQVEIVMKNEELVVASNIIEEKNKDITDSIHYAKRLQSAILKPENDMIDYFPNSFIFFKPKDIVSGDFYWFEKHENKVLVAAVDCTGHGVPGAFMSILGSSLLTQAVTEYKLTQPAEILNSANTGLSKALQQKSEDDTIRDGMDLSLCCFDADKMLIEYAGANNPLWLVRNDEIIEFIANKFPVGNYLNNNELFKNNEISVMKGDMLYLFSDGYADQFGGPDGKKFRQKQLKNLLKEIYIKPLSEQKNMLENSLKNWMGKHEQIDDVLVIGIRI